MNFLKLSLRYLFTILLLSSCSKDCKQNTIIFESPKGIITLHKVDFEVTDEVKNKYIHLSILNQDKLDSIKKMVDCKIFICLDREYTADGIDIKSSIKPRKSDYFFPEDKNQRITFFNGKSLRLLNSKAN